MRDQRTAPRKEKSFTVDTVPETALARTRRNNFVTAGPQPAPMERTQSDLPMPMHSAAQSLVKLEGTYTDRANGFVRASVPLSLVTGTLSVVLAVSTFSVPLLSAGALLAFMSVFAATWLAGWIGHLLISPEGAVLYETASLWRMLREEQRHRHERFWYESTGRRDGRQ